MNWDYSPAREATALVYPIFEYTLLVYIFLNYYQVKNEFDNGQGLGTAMMLASTVLFWVKIVLVAWFRMIFVVTVTQEPIPIFGVEIPPTVGHTMGFLGMQLALILVAFENVLQVLYTTDRRIFKMSPKVTNIGAVVYLTLLVLVTVFKISWCLSLFATGKGWIPDPWPHVFDRFWMVLAAILPILFAIDGMRTELDFEITFANKPRDPTNNLPNNVDKEFEFM